MTAQGYLTTHVLDTARGVPAEGVGVLLYRVSVGAMEQIAETRTNDDGRTDAPILPPGEMRVGEYELLFHVGPYLEAHAMAGPGTKFLDRIPIRFGIDDDTSHYHVPLLLSPYGYSTYRGS